MAEYQIEVCGPRNEYVFFPPVPSVVNHRGGLRGRWDFGKTAHRDKGEGSWLKELAYEVQQIPGIVIAVNTTKMQGLVYDPLSVAPGAAILQKVNELRRRIEGAGYEIQGAWPRVDRKLDVNTLKEWLYWMRRILDRGEAEIVPGSGQIPTLEAIQAMPGRRRADPYYTGQSMARSAEESANFGNGTFGLWPWADEVAVDGKAPAGT